MVAILAFFGSMLLAAAAWLALTEGLRTVRSRSMAWPSQLYPKEQAKICRQFFRRQGLDTVELPLFGTLHDLELKHGLNHVYLCFRNAQFAVTEIFLKDLSAIQNRRFGSVMVIVVPSSEDAAKIFVPPEAKLAPPILYPVQLKELCALLLKNSPTLRLDLLRISIPYTNATSGLAGKRATASRNDQDRKPRPGVAIMD